MVEKRLCWQCKTNLPGIPKNISFEHEGLPVTVFKSGMECASCLQDEWQASFEKYGRELINIKDGSSVVNWRFYIEQSERGSRGIADHMNILLLSLGIFSTDHQDSWGIMASGPIGLGPELCVGHARFNRLEDAAEFARLRYANTQFDWEINHITESISKEKVLCSKPE